jgi:hypothetical protein
MRKKLKGKNDLFIVSEVNVWLVRIQREWRKQIRRRFILDYLITNFLLILQMVLLS